MSWDLQHRSGAALTYVAAALAGFSGFGEALAQPPARIAVESAPRPGLEPRFEAGLDRAHQPGERPGVGAAADEGHHASNRYFDVAQYQPRGVLSATRMAAFSTNLVATVAKLDVKEGESFDQGDLLVAFDCRRQRAELKAREAIVQEMNLTLASSTYLAHRAAGGRQDVDIARARLKKAEADLDAIAAEVSNCDVIAPFAGAVSELRIKMHELPVSGQPFLSIVSNADLEVVAIVPSRWLRWLTTGLKFQYEIDELAIAVDVEITRLGQAIDPVSQTVKIFGRPLSDLDGLKAGMSGRADFSRHLLAASRAR